MNIQLSSQETKLKALIEDMGAGARSKAFKADMTLKLHGSKLGGITYDQAMTLVRENNDVLEHMSPFDPAFEYMVTQRNDMLRWATAINDSEIMGRHEHEIPIHALVSVGDVTVEANFHIPQLYYHASTRERSIKAKIIECIHAASDWTPSRRFPADIDFVELS